MPLLTQTKAYFIWFSIDHKQVGKPHHPEQMPKPGK
jgi:hypothetical protein